jgi:hypothetical protein
MGKRACRLVVVEAAIVCPVRRLRHQTGGWVMVRQRAQGEALAYVGMRGEVMVGAMSGGLGSHHATYGQGFAGDGRAT